MKTNCAILIIAAFAAQQANADAPDSQAVALCHSEWNGKIANVTMTDKSRSFKSISRSVCATNFDTEESFVMDAEYDYETPTVASMLFKTMPPVNVKYFAETFNAHDGSEISAAFCTTLGGSLMQDLVPGLGYTQDGKSGDFLPFCHFGDGSKGDMRVLYEMQRTPFIANRENKLVKVRAALSDDTTLPFFSISKPFFIISEPVTDCTKDADCTSQEDKCSNTGQPMVCSQQNICVSAVQKCSSDADCNGAKTYLKSFDENQNGQGYCVPTSCDANTNTCVAHAAYRDL